MMNKEVSNDNVLNLYQIIANCESLIEQSEYHIARCEFEIKFNSSMRSTYCFLLLLASIPLLLIFSFYIIFITIVVMACVIMLYEKAINDFVDLKKSWEYTKRDCLEAKSRCESLIEGSKP